MNEDHVIGVCPEQVSIHTTPMRLSSSSSNEVVISVDEISVSMEDTANVIAHPEAAALSSGETQQCRFCHEEDLVRHLEAPCACIGTLLYAHRSCNTKGDILCEICRQPYVPDYTVTENSSTQTRVVMDSTSPSTPTTVTQVQSPLQLPDQRATSLVRWAHLMVPCRGLLYAILLVLFLLALIVNDVFSFTKTTKKELKKAINIIFVVIMMLLAPFSLLSCLYECQVTIAKRLEERNRRALVEGSRGSSNLASM